MGKLTTIVLGMGIAVSIAGCEGASRAVEQRESGRDRWTALAPDVPLLGLFKYEDEHVICYMYYEHSPALYCFRK